jgi:simple sugar transport system permease protein
MTALSPRRLANALLIPVLAVITALLIGALTMSIFGDDPVAAYTGLARGAFEWGRPLAGTVRRMTPLVFTGLSVAVAFQGGLFNIGASGQFLMGTIGAVAVGTNFEGLPALIHIPLALVAGIAAGMIWGAIPGILKVTTGAHEVIITIMLNYIAANFAGWTVYAGGSQGQTPGPLWDPTAGAVSETADIFQSAELPLIAGPAGYRLHYGIILSLLVALLMWWLLYKTIIGFEIRTVGLNSKAARYAGIRVPQRVILAMVLAGGLAGLAGAVETLGHVHKYAPEFSGAAGFDGITVALLGQTHPLGVVLSAFLLGALDAGASRMQFDSGVAADVIQIIQALVLVFVAAPIIIRGLFRLRKPKDELDATPISTGWTG